MLFLEFLPCSYYVCFWKDFKSVDAGKKHTEEKNTQISSDSKEFPPAVNTRKLFQSLELSLPIISLQGFSGVMGILQAGH